MYVCTITCKRLLTTGEEEFSTKVTKYNNICHVLFVLEQMLRDASINLSLEAGTCKIRMYF